jgi:hypothetical protein
MLGCVMKPNKEAVEPGQPNQIESHPPATLRSQVITAVKLFTVAGALFLVLWCVDWMVSS